ncbi:MAG: metal ABC transporter permease [Spirochaetales bacterium]|nr:metal ABC transporter permease [Spirochaetales bacterium]MBR6200626.1 metal ABC transporter permease [Spirochaetales bacterium]
MNLIETIKLYFSYPFVIYALITGVLISLCASLFGVSLVLKRFSYIGDGLSHSAFGALAIASVLRISNSMLIVMPVTVLLAVLILCAKENSKIKGDAAVSMISVGALALGYLIMNIFSPPSNLSGDVCSTLFGSTLILTLQPSEVIMSVVMSVIVVLFFIFAYNRIFAVTFDEEFAAVSGTNVKLYKIIISIFIAIIIVLAMNLVGSLLISALIIFPTVSALQLFKSFKTVTIFSCGLSVLCAVIGIFIAVVAGTPVGPTIVAADILAFGVCKVIGVIYNS